MSGQAVPSDAPPPYDTTSANSSTGVGSSVPSHVQGGSAPVATPTPPRTSDRDIEQENRPLPPHWVPQFDNHQDRFFFVDTSARPPRSTWSHPLDDAEWLATVPAGRDPQDYISELWHNEPHPTPEPQRRTLPQYNFNAQQGLPGVRQGGTHRMQGQYPGTQTMTQGQGQPRMVTMEDLVQHELQKMGTPEEYARQHPPSKGSKLFHHKESASKRQRRHAEHRAQDLADELSYRSPVMSPYASPYGYPGYGRGYGAYYPGMGMSGAFLGLGAGALLGAALW